MNEIQNPNSMMLQYTLRKQMSKIPCVLFARNLLPKTDIPTEIRTTGGNEKMEAHELILSSFRKDLKDCQAGNMPPDEDDPFKYFCKMQKICNHFLDILEKVYHH